MTSKNFFLPVFILLCQLVAAQKDSVYVMDEVVITDTQLKHFSNSQSVQRLNDSVIKRNQPSLTSLLQYNTVIYFKENGLGMVSSPSFRGTTASQTAVIWNGININSQLNGQTDFNTIGAANFNTIDVRAGGGSVIYGSSAIGGSIHLNNELAFTDEFSNEIKFSYGSFNTLGANYKVIAAGKHFSSHVSISRNSSDNDYEYPGRKIKNENGQFYNSTINTAFGYKINDKNIIKLYSYVFEGERHFSRTTVAPSKNMYQNLDTHNLIEWESKFGRFTSRVKAAHLLEDYKFFENYQTDNFEYGRVNTYIARYDVSYNFSDAIQLNTIVDYTINNGEGSGISLNRRETGTVSFLMKHEVADKLKYELGVRKESSDVYASPMLFSAGAAYDVADFYSIKVNGSRNFRVPTFNDLYWQGSGNPNLRPETSYQAEFGNNFHYKGISLSLTGYYIKLTDMLRWVPSGNLWMPENLDNASSYGLESVAKWLVNLRSSTIHITGTYAYTRSHKDTEEFQLIYVPYHKATASLSYSYKNFSAYYTHMFNGEVFTTSDNTSKLDAHNISNIGVEYTFDLFGGIDLGMQVLNIWSEEYENVAKRPLPGRNYNAYLNLKF